MSAPTSIWQCSTCGESQLTAGHAVVGQNYVCPKEIVQLREMAADLKKSDAFQAGYKQGWQSARETAALNVTERLTRMLSPKSAEERIVSVMVFKIGEILAKSIREMPPT